MSWCEHPPDYIAWISFSCPIFQIQRNLVYANTQGLLDRGHSVKFHVPCLDTGCLFIWSTKEPKEIQRILKDKFNILEFIEYQYVKSSQWYQTWLN